MNQIVANSIGAPHTKAVQFISVRSKSEPVTLGRQRIGIMSRVKALDAVPTTGLHLPRFHGPGRNLLPTKKVRIVMGIVKATQAPMAPTEKMAPMATGPANSSSVSSDPMTALHQTAMPGVLVAEFTFSQYRDSGKHPSRAYANVTLQATTKQPNAKQKKATNDSARQA